MLASGIVHADIIQDFPDSKEKDIVARLAFAADRERKVDSVKA